MAGATEFDEAEFSAVVADDLNGNGLDDMSVNAPFDARYCERLDGAPTRKALSNLSFKFRFEDRRTISTTWLMLALLSANE